MMLRGLRALRLVPKFSATKHVFREYTIRSFSTLPPTLLVKADDAAEKNLNEEVIQDEALDRKKLLDAYNTLIKSDLYEYLYSSQELFEVDSRDIFANTEIHLDRIKVLGFDHDFTLVSYTNDLQHLIFNLARDYMVNVMSYPQELSNVEFDRNFAIRGLMFDTEKGLLVKLNSQFHISLDCVFRGRTKLSRNEALSAYNGNRFISKDYGKTKMKGILDLFSLAEACLLSELTHYFHEAKIDFNPLAIFDDAHRAIGYAHKSGKLHNAVMDDVEKFIHPSPHLETILRRFREGGKQTFLISNSRYEFVNAGLQYVIGSHWRELFDLVITSANKPNFYTSKAVFREIDLHMEDMIRHRQDEEDEFPYEKLLDEDEQRNAASERPRSRIKFTQVNELSSQRVYSSGNLTDLMRLTGWKGSEVLYIGDHLFADLIEPARMQGWLESEVKVQTQNDYQALIIKFQLLEELLRRLQFNLNSSKYIASSDGSIQREQNSKTLYLELDALEIERQELRVELSNLINKNFGSIFRTDSAASMFASSVERYVDIYTSRLENFLNYDINYRFYPRRTTLPHEPPHRHGLLNNLFNSAFDGNFSKEEFQTELKNEVEEMRKRKQRKKRKTHNL